MTILPRLPAAGAELRKAYDRARVGARHHVRRGDVASDQAAFIGSSPRTAPRSGVCSNGLMHAMSGASRRTSRSPIPCVSPSEETALLCATPELRPKPGVDEHGGDLRLRLLADPACI